MFAKSYPPLTALWCCLVALFCEAASAQDPAAPAADTRAVVRVSRQLLDDLVPRKFDEPFDFDTVEGPSRVVGSGRATGEISVQLVGGVDTAEFTIVIRGRTDKRIRASERSVTLHTCGGGPLVATGGIRFDGRRFSPTPSTATSQQRLRIVRICSQRRGLLGRLVRKIGLGQARQRLPGMNRRIGQSVEENSVKSLDKITGDASEQLNTLFSEHVAQTLTALDGTTDDWRLRLSSHGSYIEAALGPTPSTAALADVASSHTMRAEIEVWAKAPDPEEAAVRLAEIWGESHAALKELLPPTAAQELPADLPIRTDGPWICVLVGAAL